MNKIQIVALVISTIASFGCCLFITDAQLHPQIQPEIDVASVVQDKPEVTRQLSFLNKLKSWYTNTVDSLKEKFKADSESEPTNSASFDFSMNGDKASRSVNLITTLPVDSLDGYARAQLFYMSLKGNSDAMDNPRTSLSYMLQLEGTILPTIGGFISPRGHFEIENDPTIDTDPHLHLSVYQEIRISKNWLKGGLGYWAEAKQSMRNSKPTDMSTRLNNHGIRMHVDIEFKKKWGGITMEVEFLPRLRFDEFSIRTSPELKINLCDSLSFRIIAEVDYDSERHDITIEQFFDLFKPLDTSLTHLWSIEF